MVSTPNLIFLRKVAWPARRCFFEGHHLDFFRAGRAPSLGPQTPVCDQPLLRNLAMTVIKRSRQDTTADLVAALAILVPLLKNQQEHDAATALTEAADALRKAKPGSAGHKEVVDTIVEAFEGEHELMAYTLQRDSSAGQWTEVEELSQASARVISLARRMQ